MLARRSGGLGPGSRCAGCLGTIGGVGVEIVIDKYDSADYLMFLWAKRQPIHRVIGNVIHVDGIESSDNGSMMSLHDGLFDYQKFIVKLALARKRFAIFADVGLGKTYCFLEWVRHVSKIVWPKKVLIITQLHLINQTIEEQLKFFRWTNILDINQSFGGDIQKFLDVENTSWAGAPVGIVNVDKFNSAIRLQDHVGAVVLDESSCLKSETSVRRTNIINACRGIRYKLACTATPAPNDRQEYANHALFLDYIDNYKQFFTKFFYNTGSGNDFCLKPHARRAFYEFLATFSIFMKNPSRYGFTDNLKDLLPAEVIWDKVSLTQQQIDAAMIHGGNGQMTMFGSNLGGIANRNKISQIAKWFIYENSAD